MNIAKQTSEILLDKAIVPITLSDGHCLKAKVLPLGGIISSIRFKEQEVTLGYQTFSSYLTDKFYLGATVGRYANRISGGQFNLSGAVYKLTKNQVEHCLHGGNTGFSHKIWQIKHQTNNSVTLYLYSEDMEEGFPGELHLYQKILLKDNKVHISYQATTSKQTVINITNHCYFNLNTDKSQIANHELYLASDHYLPINQEGIPKGLIEPVNETCFDFRQAKPLAKLLIDTHSQVVSAKGLDHCFVIPNNLDTKIEKMPLVASLFSPQSGITLDLYTTQPGIHVYTGNYLADPFYENAGVCLEAQSWPDAPNHNNFPSTVLNPDESYKQEIIYAFK